jgi:predicted nucleic acid-binding protein
MVSTAHHRFWPDDVSLLAVAVADRTRIHGPRQVTDRYLLARAVRHRGRFVSFDAGIPHAAVRGAERKHLVAPVTVADAPRVSRNRRRSSGGNKGGRRAA